MITIQGFAKLCGCNTQTLRYYDRIGLLKPARVDEWTGYRYYEEEQALLFVKIKNLQQADFSIEEIKALLPGDDDLLISAFDRKVKEQQSKLERIREIQRSYLREKMDMQNMVHTLIDYMERQMNNPVIWKEFGLDNEQGTEIRAKVHDQLVDWLTQCRDASGEIAQQMNGRDVNALKELMDRMDSGNPEGESMLFTISGGKEDPGEDLPAHARKVYACSGWEHVSEWIHDIPALDSSKQSWFLFRVCGDSPVSNPGFPTLMLAVMDNLYGTIKGGMNCKVGRSGDGLNHFTLMQA